MGNVAKKREWHVPFGHSNYDVSDIVTVPQIASDVVQKNRMQSSRPVKYLRLVSEMSHAL